MSNQMATIVEWIRNIPKLYQQDIVDRICESPNIPMAASGSAQKLIAYLEEAHGLHTTEDVTFVRDLCNWIDSIIRDFCNERLYDCRQVEELRRKVCNGWKTIRKDRLSDETLIDWGSRLRNVIVRPPR